MTRPKRAAPPLFAMLEDAFAKDRTKIKPLFPSHAKTGVIRLPPHIEEELRYWVVTGKPVEAVMGVTALTGAGLRVSKDDVDSLVKPRERRKVHPRPSGTEWLYSHETEGLLGSRMTVVRQGKWARRGVTDRPTIVPAAPEASREVLASACRSRVAKSTRTKEATSHVAVETAYDSKRY